MTRLCFVYLDDQPVLEALLDDWLTVHPPRRLLEIDVLGEDADFSGAVERVVA